MEKENLTKRRCLVVDDNYDIFLIIEAGLANQFDCLYAADAFTAHQMINSQFFDLLLCDIRMPHMDGFQLVEELQKESVHVPTIFVSGMIDPASVRKAFQLGAYNIVAKPINMDELLLKAETVIKMREKKAETVDESDQEVGYVYNLLKSHYYDIQGIMHQIHQHRIPMSVVMEELDKKERIGKCFLDNPENIKFLVRAA